MRSRSTAPRTGPLTARVVLTCQSCQDAWEPDLTDPAALDAAQTGCPRCGGWTWMGEITEPDHAGRDGQ